MKNLKACALIVAASFASIAVTAQTADEVIGKYIDAIGGKDKINGVTSIYLEGTIQAMGNDNPVKVTVLNGKGYKSESEFNGQKAIQCVTDQGGWSINPMGGGAAEPMPDEQYKASREQMYVGGALFNYAAKGSTATLLGKEGSNYKLKLVTSEKTETTYYIDAATYYVSKIVRKGNFMGQETEITVQLADYKKTDYGIAIPFSMNTDFGQFQLTTTFKKAEVNKPVDPSIFVMPK